MPYQDIIGTKKTDTGILEYGATQPDGTRFERFTPSTNPAYSQVGMLSGAFAENTANKDLAKLASATPPPATLDTTTIDQQNKDAQAALDAAKKEQLEAGALDEDSVKEFGGEGYAYDAKTGLYTPKNGVAKPELSEYQKELQAINTRREERAKLYEGLAADVDEATQAVIRGIEIDYAARESKMMSINRARVKAFETTGFRLGTAQYAGLIASGIVSTEEREGEERLVDLQRQKAQAIAEAKSAAATNKFTMLNKKMEQLEKIDSDRMDALKEQDKLIAEEAKKLKEEEKLANISVEAIALMKQGITDPKDLVLALRKLGIKVNAKEMKDFTDAFIPEDAKDQLKEIGNIYQSALNMGAPKEVQDAILASKTMVDAYRAAGVYATSATGIVGEYNLYKNQMIASGKTPLSFDEYQTADVNRKAKAKAIAEGTYVGAPGGVTPEGRKFSQNALAYAKDYNKTGNLPSAADMKYAGVTPGEILDAAKTLPKELTATEIAKRDTMKSSLPVIDEKLNLIKDIADNPYLNTAVGPNKLGRISLTDVFSGGKQNVVAAIEQLISQETLATLLQLKAGGGTLGAISEKELAILQGAATKINSWRVENWMGTKTDGYAVSEDLFKKELDKIKASAERLKKGIEDSLKVTDAMMPTGQALMLEESDAETKVKDYLANNPTKEAEIAQHIQELEKANGGPISSLDFLKAFPEYQ